MSESDAGPFAWLPVRTTVPVVNALTPVRSEPVLIVPLKVGAPEASRTSPLAELMVMGAATAVPPNVVGEPGRGETSRVRFDSQAPRRRWA